MKKLQVRGKLGRLAKGKEIHAEVEKPPSGGGDGDGEGDGQGGGSSNISKADMAKLSELEKKLLQDRMKAESLKEAQAQPKAGESEGGSGEAPQISNTMDWDALKPNPNEP